MLDPLALLGRLVEGSVDFVVIGGLAAMKRAASKPKDMPKLAELLELRDLTEQ